METTCSHGHCSLLFCRFLAESGFWEIQRNWSEQMFRIMDAYLGSQMTVVSLGMGWTFILDGPGTEILSPWDCPSGCCRRCRGRGEVRLVRAGCLEAVGDSEEDMRRVPVQRHLRDVDLISGPKVVTVTLKVFCHCKQMILLCLQIRKWGYNFPKACLRWQSGSLEKHLWTIVSPYF